MKKHLALVLALVMVLSSFSFVSAAPDFADVDGTMYEEAVDRLELLNILKGYPDGTFRPEDTITRAEFATVAVRTLGLAGAAESAVGLPSGFSDVPAHHWAARFVGTAASAGIVNGIGNGLFAPEAPVKYEEAVTMLVRALGYGPEAQSRGGYPYGYLIVAEQIDLLDGVRAVQGTFASRGTVALLTDNALELPMMVSIGFGDNIRWVVSGTERTEEVTLLDEMGFDAVEGRLSEYDDDDMEIYINDEEENDSEGWYEVAEGFDFYEFHGASVKAWVDGDEVLVIKATEDLMFDAVEVTEDAEEIKLIDANKKYDVDADAYVWINGDEADAEDLLDGDKHNYVKVGLNSENDVMFYEGYTWDGYIVFEELDTDDDFIYGYEWELDIEDFTFVKDGKTVAVADLEAGDMVFYNEDADFAEVFNMSVEGEFEEIFSTTFEIDGEEFEYMLDNFSGISGVHYVDEYDEMAVFDDEIAVIMEDEGEVAVFVDRFGNAVFVTGELGDIAKSTFGALLYKTMAGYVDIRGRERLELQVVTEMAEEATYDFRLSDLEFIEVNGTEEWNDDDADLTLDTNTVVGNKTTINVPTYGTITIGNYVKGEVVELTVDSDGDVVGLNFFTSVLTEGDDNDVQSGDTYIANRRMSNTVPLFFIAEGVANWDDADVEVVMYGDLEEDVEIINYDLYNDGAKGLYMVVTDSNMEAVITEMAIVTQVRVDTDGDITRVRAFVGNTEITYYTEDPISMSLAAGQAVELKIIESSERVQSIDVLDRTATPNAEIATLTVTATNLTATSNGRKINNYTLVSGGYIFDVTDDEDIDTMSFAELNDVKVGTFLTFVFEKAGNTTYVKYVLVNTSGVAPAPGDTTEGVVTYINTTSNEGFAVAGTAYVIDANTVLKNSAGNVIAIGIPDVANGLDVGDQVEVEDNVITIVKTKEALAEAAEQKVVDAELAKVADAYEVAYGTADITAAAATLVEADVDTAEVNVAVTYADSKYTVTLTSKEAAPLNAVKAEKVITVTVAAASTDVSITGVTVQGLVATVDSGDATVYNVTLPTGTTLDGLETVVVTATDNNASVGTPATESPFTTWTVVVTAEDTTTETYTINVTVAE